MQTHAKVPKIGLVESSKGSWKTEPSETTGGVHLSLNRSDMVTIVRSFSSVSVANGVTEDLDENFQSLRETPRPWDSKAY